MIRVVLAIVTALTPSGADPIRCLRSRNFVNVIVAGKQPALQYLDIGAAVRHVENGIGIWG